MLLLVLGFLALVGWGVLLFLSQGLFLSFALLHLFAGFFGAVAVQYSQVALRNLIVKGKPAQLLSLDREPYILVVRSGVLLLQESHLSQHELLLSVTLSVLTDIELGDRLVELVSGERAFGRVLHGTFAGRLLRLESCELVLGFRLGLFWAPRVFLVVILARIALPHLITEVGEVNFPLALDLAAVFLILLWLYARLNPFNFLVF